MKFTGWKKGAAALLGAALVAGTLAGCGASTSKKGKTTATATAGKPVIGGTIEIETIGNFRDIDPAHAYDVSSQELTEQLYDRLVTYKTTTNDIIPMVAKSWDVSKDGKTYTFHLRHDVKFWNGDPVTAQSFLDEMTRVLNPKIGSTGEGFLDPIVVGSTAYNKGQAKTVTGLSTPDPYTLVIKLTKPEPFFLEVLAMPFFSAVEQKFIDKVGNRAFDTKDAMGSGPFELQSYNNTKAVLVRNPHYFMVDKYGNHLPYLDKIIINVDTNAQVDGMHFQKGTTAMLAWNTEGLPSTLYPKFMATPSLKKDVIDEPANSVDYLGLNPRIKPFDKLKVRQAVEYAINKQRLMKLMNNRFMVADQPLPPGLKGYVKNLDPDATYTYDPAKAKELLKEAGYPNGVGMPPVTLYLNNSPDRVKLAAAIQNMMEAVGFKVKIDAMDWNSYLDIAEKGKCGIFMLGWIQDFPDASDFLNTLFNSNQIPANNMSCYSNPQVDKWLNEAQVMPNGPARWALYAKVTNQVMKDAAWVPYFVQKNIFAIQPWVHGFYINPTLMDPLQCIWIDQAHSLKS